MKNGRIAQIGKYDEILNPGSDFIQLVGAQSAAMSTLDSNMAAATDGNVIVRHGVVNGETDDEKTASLGTTGQLIKEEQREKGGVGFSVYWKYITTTYGGVFVFFIILANILLQVLQLGSTYWLAWAAPSADIQPVVSRSTLMIAYASFTLGICFCTVFVDMFIVTIGYKTATILFRKMLQSIFHAPMSFFDATPSGRILNRVSDN